MKLSTLRNSSLDQIPGAALEITRLSSMLNGDYYFGSEAQEQHFKAIAADYAILHLALHGEVDYENSENSKLYFMTGQEQGPEDGILYPFEIYGMDLNAQLAVLSACETGAGKLTSGEGIMSLGRAFQFAGVGSLLLSRWEVSDPVSPEIMEAFYRYLLQGANKSQALRQAKLEFLDKADNIASIPYYWGGFFILGDDRPIQLKSGNNRNLRAAGVIILLLIITALYLARRKRTSN